MERGTNIQKKTEPKGRGWKKKAKYRILSSKQGFVLLVMKI